MKKGQIVKCVGSRNSNNITLGKEYIVTAGIGDNRRSFTGQTLPFTSESHAMIKDDDGDMITIIVPECAYGKWKVVS